MPSRPFLQRLRWKGLVVAAYLLLGVAGISALQVPSVSLGQQGGRSIVVLWSSCCILGMILGFLGFFLARTVIEIVGLGLLTAASLTWAVAVILQAKASTNGVAPTVTAICVALSVTALLAQRFLDVRRAPQR
jgi:hypothetical protein